MKPLDYSFSPDCQDPELASACQVLEAHAEAVSLGEAWPGLQFEALRRAGVFRWFVPVRFGGDERGPAETASGFVQLASACLTTTFVLTQLAAAIRRIVGSSNEEVVRELAGRLAAGDSLATVGISHLTTSRRHLAVPAVQAAMQAAQIRLRGTAPWVTGAADVEYLVLGAETDARAKLLLLVPADAPGVRIGPPQSLVALNGSRTCAVSLDDVVVPSRYLLAGPTADASALTIGVQTGGLQTSALAIGLARRACQFLSTEASRRGDLELHAEALSTECTEVTESLMAATISPEASLERLRQRANSLVLRATQAALAASKGAGFVRGHPAGRWCAEALFFLVWSCPQAVVEANLCELSHALP